MVIKSTRTTLPVTIFRMGRLRVSILSILKGAGVPYDGNDPLRDERLSTLRIGATAAIARTLDHWADSKSVGICCSPLSRLRAASVGPRIVVGRDAMGAMPGVLPAGADGLDGEVSVSGAMAAVSAASGSKASPVPGVPEQLCELLSAIPAAGWESGGGSARDRDGSARLGLCAS